MMKNILKSKTVLIILILTTSGLFIIPGCKKDLKTLPSKEVSQTSLDIKFTNMLEVFKTKMKSTLKDGDGLPVDSVVWYLEGCLNLTYARASDSIGHIWEDSTIMEIPVNGEIIFFYDLNFAYSSLVNQLSEHYYSIDGDKDVVFIDIELLEVHQESIVIQMRDYVAEKPGPPNPCYIPSFSHGENWIWGLGMDRCEINTYTGEDAATQIAAKANILGYGSGIYWLYIYTTQEIYPWNTRIQTSTNPFGYLNSLLFENSGTGSEPEDCLESDKLNYYLNNLRMIGLIFKPYGRSVMNYSLESSAVVGGGWGHEHIATISYGVPVSIGIPPEEVPPPYN